MFLLFLMNRNIQPLNIFSLNSFSYILQADVSFKLKNVMCLYPFVVLYDFAQYIVQQIFFFMCSDAFIFHIPRFSCFPSFFYWFKILCVLMAFNLFLFDKVFIYISLVARLYFSFSLITFVHKHIGKDLASNS